MNVNASVMKKLIWYGAVPFIAVSALASAVISCEELDNDPAVHAGGSECPVPPVSLDRVAAILAEIPVGPSQLEEVYAAVSSSSENGYDEEYMMRDLFRLPGSGVGDDRIVGKSSMSRESISAKAGTPDGSGDAGPAMRDLIREYLYSSAQTKAGGTLDTGYGTSLSPDDFLSALEGSDIQIYWPYSENWDGSRLPVITFDPSDGSETNVGYEIVAEDGYRKTREIVVDEKTAMERPVWVVNRNDDSEYTSLEILRQKDPDWGSGGGSVTPGAISGPGLLAPLPGPASPAYDQTSQGQLKTLVLKEFTMKRNYDPWFAGASEFFVKMGSVESFTASTEAELKLYSPTVTDFMIVVKRKNVGVPQPFNAVLVSEWTDQLESCAFLITEDDGGTRTSWKCTALVRVASKSYGVEIDIPVNTRDDIVWRGQLSSRYIQANSNVTGHFGDVDLKFEIISY